MLPKLPKDYRVVLLKNEFGDVEGEDEEELYSLDACLIFWWKRVPLLDRASAVDSQLAKQSSLAAVSEILNGCM